MPEEHNTEAKILHCGSLEDIIDAVEAKNIRQYLLKKYAGYLPGVIERLEGDKRCKGTISYRGFMDKVEHIDGMGQLIFEAKLAKPLDRWHNAVYGGKELDPSVIWN